MTIWICNFANNQIGIQIMELTKWQKEIIDQTASFFSAPPSDSSPGKKGMGKIFFWHYSIKIIGNFLICFLLLNWFFSIKFIRLFSNRKMSIINRKNSIKFQNIWQNSICYKALCCQKVKVQNWSSWLSWLWLSL